MQALDQAMTAAYRDLIAQQEAYLLEFFGSLENAERFGHLYVFETHPATLAEGEEIGAYSLRQEFRIRPKTEEELAAERLRGSVDNASA